VSEAQHQETLVEWFRLQYPKYSRCIRLSLNGVPLPAGKAAAIIMAKMKKQGLTPDEADLFFAVPNLEYHGLFIELKSPSAQKSKQKPRPGQQDYLDLMTDLGYRAVCCVGFDEARKEVCAYMRTSVRLDRPVETPRQGPG
jgi:hypothetical protein